MASKSVLPSRDSLHMRRIGKILAGAFGLAAGGMSGGGVVTRDAAPIRSGRAGVGGRPPAAGLPRVSCWHWPRRRRRRSWPGRRRGWRTTSWIRRSPRRYAKRRISNPPTSGPVQQLNDEGLAGARADCGRPGADREVGERRRRPTIRRRRNSRWPRRNWRWMRTSWKMRNWISRGRAATNAAQLERAAQEHAEAQKEPAPSARPVRDEIR